MYVINTAPAITASDALNMLRILGITLALNDGRLAASPAHLIDDDVRWLIRKYRDDILMMLSEVPMLVRAVGHEYGFDADEIREALEAADRDPAGAWVSYRAMADKLQLVITTPEAMK
jgi:hypothetical protein